MHETKPRLRPVPSGVGRPMAAADNTPQVHLVVCRKLYTILSLPAVLLRCRLLFLLRLPLSLLCMAPLFLADFLSSVIRSLPYIPVGPSVHYISQQH